MSSERSVITWPLTLVGWMLLLLILPAVAEAMVSVLMPFIPWVIGLITMFVVIRIWLHRSRW